MSEMWEHGGGLQDGYGPQGWLHGMRDPRAWVYTLTTHLTTVEPQARATTGRLPSGLTGVMLTLAVMLPPPVHVLLVPHPTRVRVQVWTPAWVTDPPAADQQDVTFMVVVRAMLLVAFTHDPTPVILLLRPFGPPTAATEGFS